MPLTPQQAGGRRGGLKGKGHVQPRGICPLCLREYGVNGIAGSGGRVRSHMPHRATFDTVSHDDQVPLPTTCDCGGRMVYDRTHGRVWSHCDTCTPVVRVRLETTGGADG